MHTNRAERFRSNVFNFASEHFLCQDNLGRTDTLSDIGLTYTLLWPFEKNFCKGNCLLPFFLFRLDPLRGLVCRKVSSHKSCLPCKKCQGRVFQSIVSLKSSLVVKMLTVLVSTIFNSQVFLLKKCE